jgi:hypothetical protein
MHEHICLTHATIRHRRQQRTIRCAQASPLLINMSQQIVLASPPDDLFGRKTRRPRGTSIPVADYPVAVGDVYTVADRIKDRGHRSGMSLQKRYLVNHGCLAVKTIRLRQYKRLIGWPTAQLDWLICLSFDHGTDACSDGNQRVR